jgi:hypothetical protein
VTFGARTVGRCLRRVEELLEKNVAAAFLFVQVLFKGILPEYVIRREE